MCKKVLIATVAVLAGLAVVSSTKLGSYAKLKWRNATTWAKKQVPLETQIARIRQDLNDLQKEDDKHFDKVARQEVDVARREREVTQLKSQVTKLEGNIRHLRDQLAGGGEFVTVGGEQYSRDQVHEQIRTDFVTFEALEERAKSQTEQLKLLKRSLTVNRKKLKELEQDRENMKNELIRLETTLAEQRMAAQAQGDVAIDDSNYSRLKKEIAEIRDELEVRKTVLRLKGENLKGPIRERQEAKERDAKIDSAIEKRFGKTEKVAGNK
jgi:peptidoglycan hydrolase CwlO-like protein